MSSTLKGKAPASEPRVTRLQAMAFKEPSKPLKPPAKFASELKDLEEKENIKAVVLKAFKSYVQKLEECLNGYPFKQAFNTLK